MRCLRSLLSNGDAKLLAVLYRHQTSQLNVERATTRCQRAGGAAPTAGWTVTAGVVAPKLFVETTVKEGSSSPCDAPGPCVGQRGADLELSMVSSASLDR